MTSLLQDIAQEVSREFGSTPAAILAPTRGKPEEARARAIAMYVYAKSGADVPGKEPCLSAVGRAFGRDRTTVRHAHWRVKCWMVDRAFARKLSLVQQRVAAIGYPGGVL